MRTLPIPSFHTWSVLCATFGALTANFPLVRKHHSNSTPQTREETGIPTVIHGEDMTMSVDVLDRGCILYPKVSSGTAHGMELPR